LGGHEVHLSAAAVVVARQDLPSSLLEEGGGDRLGGVPALAPLLGPRRSMPHAASTTTAAFRKVPTSVRWTICTPCPANHWRAFASLCWSSGASSSKGASSTKGPPEASVTATASAARAASRSSWSSSVKRETPDSPLSASPPAPPQPTDFHLPSVSAARSCEARFPSVFRRVARSHPAQAAAASSSAAEGSALSPSPPSRRRTSAISGP